MNHFPFVWIICNQSLKNWGIRLRFNEIGSLWIIKKIMLPLLDVTTRLWFPNHETIACVTRFISPSNYFCHIIGMDTLCGRGNPAVGDFILWKVGVHSCTFPHFLSPSIIVSLRQYGWVSHSLCCFNTNTTLLLVQSQTVNYKWRKWSQKVGLGLNLTLSPPPLSFSPCLSRLRTHTQLWYNYVAWLHFVTLWCM